MSRFSMRSARTLGVHALVAATALGTAVLAACGSNSGDSTFTPSADAGSEDDSSVVPSDGAPLDTAPSTYTDFPMPIIDPTVPMGGMPAPMNAGVLFGPATNGAASGGPCLVEPEVGSMYPNNWLRPRFKWRAANGENLFELTLHVANQTQDLVVYTSATSWTMPATMWTALAQHSADVPMTVAVRGGVFGGGMLTMISHGSNGDLHIAPVGAPGSIVYWNTTTKSLFGFKVGDELTVGVMKPTQFTERTIDCVGCHSSSPDGNYVQISTKIENPFDGTTQYAEGVVDIAVATQGKTASFVGAGAKQAMAQPLRGIASFSAAHWSTGDRVLITESAPSDPSTSGELSWIDLEATTLAAATGTLARTGDTGPVAMAPTWSHDGTHVTYVSCARQVDARPDIGPADLYTIPYASRMGGAAVKVAGASTTQYEENYPAYSPDDQLLAFTRVPSGENMLFNAKKEVLVVPAAGGQPTRLTANDPPACAGTTSPGVWNSFAKWAPAVGTANGKKYYWLVFSSKRADIASGSGAPKNKLFLSPLVVDADGTMHTYAAIYLWVQGDDEDNHTPAWDIFKTPPPR